MIFADVEGLSLAFTGFEQLLVQQLFFFFFFNDTATTEIYTLSLHDALPICHVRAQAHILDLEGRPVREGMQALYADPDRKSTRLNSSHLVISYAVFCLKKKHDELQRMSSDKGVLHNKDPALREKTVLFLSIC